MAMPRVALVASCAAAFVIHAAVANKCLVPSTNGYPEVDLNPLNTDKDVVMASKSGSKYSFHMNPCGSTAFQNGACSAGSSVCEVQDSEKGLNTYGFVDTIAITRSGADLVMAMEGDDVCPFFKSKPYTAKVMFKCVDEGSATDGHVNVTKEDFYKCNIEIDYQTHHACGGKGKSYNCNAETHQCVISEDGKFPSATACLADCTVKQNKFACDRSHTDMCVESADGEYPSIQDCAANCHAGPPPPPGPSPPVNSKFMCDTKDYTCTESPNGVFLNGTDCQKNCAPWVKHYRCFNNKCVHDSLGKFPSEAACETVCGSTPPPPPPSSAYACESSQCVVKEGGSFKDHADCTAACGVLYYCDWQKGECAVSDHGVPDKSVCASVCTAEAGWNASKAVEAAKAKPDLGPRGYVHH